MRMPSPRNAKFVAAFCIFGTAGAFWIASTLTLPHIPGAFYLLFAASQILFLLLVALALREERRKHAVMKLRLRGVGDQGSTLSVKS